MFPICRENGVAAITYNPIQSTDLTKFGPQRKPPGWESLKPSQKGSIIKFAWEIREGDVICVRDSMRQNLMVGRGYVRGAAGRPAYRYAPRSPIRTKTGETWRHLINVDWDIPFAEFHYKDRSPNTTVLKLEEGELAEFLEKNRRAEHKASGLDRLAIERALILEDAYPRATPATIRLIYRRHVSLSKRFMEWLSDEHAISAERERSQIDMRFNLGRRIALVEFKVAYNGNTKAAIREALGQVLEYNHYPGRGCNDLWFLVLDVAPSADDLAFIEALRMKLSFPLILAWWGPQAFAFYPSWPQA